MCRVAFCFLFAIIFHLWLRRQVTFSYPLLYSFGLSQYPILLKVYLVGISYRYVVRKRNILLVVSDNCYYSLIVHQSLTVVFAYPLVGGQRWWKGQG